MNTTDLFLHSLAAATAADERNQPPVSSSAGTCASDHIDVMQAVLARMLDEIDHGVMLLTATGFLRHANRLASHLLGSGKPLHLLGSKVGAHGEEHTQLLRALADSARGVRRLITLDTMPVAVVPLACSAGGNEPLAMLLLGRRQSDAAIAMSLYASSCRLTPAEAEVLRSLCMGISPKEFARRAGVAISTVRTQIGSIRDKTGAASLRDLIGLVAALPPMTSVFQSGAAEPRRSR